MTVSRTHAAPLRRLERFLSSAAGGKEKLWRVWWMAGIPLGWTLSALLICAEDLRDGGYHGWGNFFDLARLLVLGSRLYLSARRGHGHDDDRATSPTANIDGMHLVCPDIYQPDGGFSTFSFT